MEINDVVTVLTTTGEYVGKLIERTDDTLTLKDPRMILQSPEGQMGFARGVAVTGEENPVEMTFSTYVFVCATNETVTQAHASATGALVVPDSKIIV